MSFNFADVSTTGWIAVGALAALAVVLLVIARGHVRWTARMIANAALCLALAFACIALAAVARKLPDSWGWLAGIALGGVGRFVCHVLSGVVFFAEYAEGTGMSPLVYSVSYNSFVFVDLAICAVVMAFPQVRRALKKMTER